jgi:hypothetical protein
MWPAGHAVQMLAAEAAFVAEPSGHVAHEVDPAVAV